MADKFSWRASCIAIALVVLCLAGAYGQKQTINLEQCFQWALTSNIDVEVSKYLPQIAEPDIMIARSPYDFFVTGGYQYTKTDSLMLQEKQGIFNVDLTKRLTSGTTVSLGYAIDYTNNSDLKDARDTRRFFGAPFFDPEQDIKKLWTSSVNLRATQSLLRNFGFEANEALIKVAEKQKKIAEYEHEKNTNEVLAQVEIAYWSWIAAIRTRQAILKSVEKGYEYKKLVEAKSGKIEGVLPSDVNDAIVNIRIREDRLLTVEKEIKVAEARLKRLVFGFDTKNPMQSFGKMEFEASPEDLAAFENVAVEPPDFAYAVANRPEIKQLKEQQESLELLVARSKNLLLPDLSVSGGISLLGQDDEGHHAFGSNFNGNHWRWTVGVSLEVPLGNFAAKGELEKNRKQLYQVQASIYRSQYDIALELKEIEHNMNSLVERKRKSKESIENAEKTLESLEKRYHNPLANDFNAIFFLQDAEVKRTDVVTNESQILLEQRIALANKKKAEARYLQLYRANRK